MVNERGRAGDVKRWCSPGWVVEAARVALGGIALDPCSNEHSIVGADRAYALPQDGLALPWDAPTIYLNPPYGRDRERGTTILDWISRADDAAAAGSRVVALIPVATNTRHWKERIFPSAAAVCFLAATRLRFLLDGEEDRRGAPMAVAAVYWGDDPDRFEAAFTPYGAVVRLRR